MGAIEITLIVASCAVVAGVAGVWIYRKIKGKHTGCGCGCSDCASCSACRKAKLDEKD